jgi:small subunit ribosomal protein S9
MSTSLQWGLGRRKSAVARVRLVPGAGGCVINGRPIEQYFPVEDQRRKALAPLKLAGLDTTYDVHCNVSGGGPIGQAGAVMLGVARAIKAINPTLDTQLRAEGFLTRDSRMKERKKYGRRGARRGFQFSKR